MKIEDRLTKPTVAELPRREVDLGPDVEVESRTACTIVDDDHDDHDEHDDHDDQSNYGDDPGGGQHDCWRGGRSHPQGLISGQ